MTTLEDLERRVTALETFQSDTAETLRQTVAKLGRITAIQDEHSLRLDRIEQRLDNVEKRLDRIEQRLDRLEQRLDRVETSIDNLRRDLPGMIAETMREVLKETR